MTSIPLQAMPQVSSLVQQAHQLFVKVITPADTDFGTGHIFPVTSDTTVADLYVELKCPGVLRKRDKVSKSLALKNITISTIKANDPLLPQNNQGTHIPFHVLSNAAPHQTMTMLMHNHKLAKTFKLSALIDPTQDVIIVQLHRNEAAVAGLKKTAKTVVMLVPLILGLGGFGGFGGFMVC